MTLWCVGRNYADHAKELGNKTPDSPLIFIKAEGCITRGEIIQLPADENEYHYELEIAYRLGQDLLFDGMSLALDLTNRTAQNKLKKEGSPWCLAKSFIGSCPISEIFSPAYTEDLKIELYVNHELRQAGLVKDMIFSPEVLRQHVLQYYPIQTGDYLLTGTPAGVGRLQNGDHLQANLIYKQQKLLESTWRVER